MPRRRLVVHRVEQDVPGLVEALEAREPTRVLEVESKRLAALSADLGHVLLAAGGMSGAIAAGAGHRGAWFPRFSTGIPLVGCRAPGVKVPDLDAYARLRTEYEIGHELVDVMLRVVRRSNSARALYRAIVFFERLIG